MEARERAVAIGVIFGGKGTEGLISRNEIEGVRYHLLYAQREAIASYQTTIRNYGRNSGYARGACDRIVQLGEILLDEYS